VGKNGIEGPPPNAGMKPNHRHKMATIEKKERASREGGNLAAAPCARTGARTDINSLMLLLCLCKTQCILEGGSYIIVFLN